MDLLTALCATLLLFLCLFLSVFIYATIHIALLHAKFDHLPGPKRESFFLGNLTEFQASTRKDSEDYADEKTKALKPLMHTKLLEWADLYGDTYVFYAVYRAVVVSRSPNLLKTILVHSDQRDFPKTTQLNLQFLYGGRYLGDGLGTALEYDGWYQRRKVMEPIFHRNKLVQCIDAFNATGDCLMNELRGYAESGETFQLAPFLRLTTLDAILRVLYSVDCSKLDEEFATASSNFVRETFKEIQLIASYPPAVYSPLRWRQRKATREVMKSFRDLGARMVSERKSAILNGDTVPADFVTTMIEASMEPSSTYTFEVMVDEFVSMIAAGMENPANTLALIFMKLGERPELLQRLVEEVDEVVGKSAFINNDSLKKLSFTSTVVKETLRVYPPANVLMRTVTKETVIDGIRLPANSDLLLSLVGANTNQRYLKDADKFIPDRFDSNSEEKVPVGSFTTFGLGSKNCIGQVFGQMELKMMVAKFFQHYQMVLDESETFELGQSAGIFPLSGLKCKILVRD